MADNSLQFLNSYDAYGNVVGGISSTPLLNTAPSLSSLGGASSSLNGNSSSDPVSGTITNTVTNSINGNQITGDLQSANFLTGQRGWLIQANGSVEFGNGFFRGDITGASGTFSGTLTGGSLNIPDTTSSNSMHVDTSGNTWWGSNIAGGYATAPAYILNTGTGKFTLGTIGGWTIGTTSITATGVTLSSSGNAYLSFGTTPPTSPTTGTGIFLDKTGLFGLNANTQNFKIDATNGNITANAGTIGGFTINSTSLYGGVIKTAATVGIGNTGVIMDTVGLRGYDSVLGNTFNLPTNGSAPTFASGVINSSTFNINTNAVLRTSATVGDGSASSAGIRIDPTGIYGVGINQLLANANVRILVDGSAFFSGTFNLGSTLITVKDIALLQTAINTVAALGGGTVSLEPATYNATSTITLASGVTLDGNGSTIDFGGGAFQILIQGTNAYSTGTISVNFGSATVTGSGTSWTVGMVGQSILLGDFYYSITAVGSSTSLTIGEVFKGTSLSGDTYVIATTVDSTSILNLVVQNSSISLIKGRYLNVITINGVTTVSGDIGIEIRDSFSPFLLNWGNDTSTTNGTILNNCPYSTIQIFSILNGAGMSLTRVSNCGISVGSWQNITGVGISFTNCYNIGFVNYSVIEATSHGIEFVSGNSDIDVTDGYLNTCGGDGIKLTASSNRINLVANSVLNSTGYGVNIANANDNNNNVSTNIFTNNTSGNIHNLGTSTKIRGNQGVSDNLVEADLSLSNITTNDASTSAHGFQAKGTGSTSTFYRSDNTQASVTDANLSVSNVTTNNVSISAHGFAPIAPNDATKFLDGTGNYSTPGGATALTQIPPPVFATFAATGTATNMNSNTTLHVGMVTVPFKITANKITYREASANSTGTLQLAMFSEDGQTRLFSVGSTISGGSAATIETTLSSVAINPGNYWIAALSKSTLDVSPVVWVQDTTTSTLNSTVTSKPILTGTLTVTADTMPTTITPTSVTSGSNIQTLYFRLDN